MQTTTPLDVVLCGAAGRMGQALREAMAATADSRVVALVDAPNARWTTAPPAGVPLFDDLAAALAGTAGNVVIDFTTPAAAVAHCRLAAQRSIPFVSGTTGLSDAQHAELRAAAQSIALVWAPNMSVGICVLTDLLTRAVQALGPAFDVEIVEVHHAAKQDAPSGTALQLAEKVRAVRGTAMFIHGRQGKSAGRSPDEIGLHAVRGGDVVGDHLVMLLGPGERLELVHRASNRQAFAQGAIRAAHFVVGRPAGFYSMADVLEL